MNTFHAQLLSFTALAVVVAPTSAQTPPQYTAEWLGSAASVTAINSAGTIVGTEPLAPANERGWVAKSGSPQAPLPLPPGRISSRVYDINDTGVIAGTVSSASYADPHFGAVAAIWIPSGGGYTIQEFGKLPGDIGSAATALNSVGDIVGYSQGGMFQRAVWFTAPGGILDLTPTGAFDPRGINDQRVIVCYSTAASRLDLDTMVLENLGVPAGSYNATLGGSINASHQVAGVAILATSTSCNRQTARYTDGIGWEVFGSCGSNNGPGNINDLGDMTMRVTLSPVVRFEGIGTFTIESLVVAPVGHWFLFSGTGLINNARQITVAGTNPTTGQSGVLLLTPTTQLGTTLCSGDGSAGNCPCGNASASAARQGCLHSVASGALLTATGSANVSQDDLVLHVASAPPHKVALFLQGLPGPALPLGAGLRCMANPIKRLEPFVLDANGAGSSTISVVTHGSIAPGMSRVYQTWFRDPTGPCGQASNLSAGLRIDWQ
jgi:hypothetical protein